MKVLKKILLAVDKWVFRIANVVEFLVTAALIVAVILQVFTRYVLRSPLFWTTEFSCFMLVYIVFIGAAIALRNSEHVALDPNLIKAPKPIKKGMNMLASISVYLFIAMLFYFGLYITIANKDSLSEALKVPYSYLYGTLPVSAVMMAIGYSALLVIKHDEKQLQKEGDAQ